MPSATVSRSERFGQRQDGARQRHRVDAAGAVAFARQPLDEGPVDLEDVDGKTMQIGERGIAGAEVIEREPHAERLELLEGALEPLGILQQQALGHFEDQAVGLRADAWRAPLRTSSTMLPWLR